MKKDGKYGRKDYRGVHEWECDFAIKNKNKERAKYGFIIEKKKEWKLGKCNLIARKKEGVIRSEMEVDKEPVSFQYTENKKGKI